MAPRITSRLFQTALDISEEANKDGSKMSRRKAVVIGAGIGGISCAMRLQSLGFDTEIVEALDAPGGRAYVRKADGFVFDMGPTVLTVPHFIEELFSLQQDRAMLGEPDFPPEVLDESCRVREGISGGPNTSKYVEIIPILPFYRIYFDDGTFFDYDGDPVSTRAQIKRLAPVDLAGYEAFHDQARAIFQRGFLKLGYTYFGSLGSMLRVVPDLLKLGAVQSLFGMVSKYFKSDKMRQVFSFEPLLVGGNPMKVPAIYAMIHFVEKTWGIHYAKGGTGAAKCGGNYAASLLPQQEAYENGCPQVLFLDSQEGKYIEELGGMNVFLVLKDGTLVTPELTGSILEGVTRKSIIQLARDRGHQVQERKITIDEWRDGIASGEVVEAFACGTAAVVTPIAALKGRGFMAGDENAPAGKLTMSLRQELTDIQSGRLPDRHGWMVRLV